MWAAFFESGVEFAPGEVVTECTLDRNTETALSKKEEDLHVHVVVAAVVASVVDVAVWSYLEQVFL